MDTLGKLLVVVGGVAAGGLGFALAGEGALGPGPKAWAQGIENSLGVGQTPGTVVSVDTTGATVYCKDGAKRTRTWSQIDSDLKAAGNTTTSHDKAEAQAYATACTGS